MPRITLREATKHFSGKTEHPALDGVSLEVADGQVLVLAGPSGAGKTTLLRVVAGLESLSSGTLLFETRDMSRVPPKDRNVAMVFQSPALYPHMTVFENMGFALKVRGCPRQEREHRVREMADLLGMTDLLNRKPFELSGGQAQRTALGRALVRRPEVFLLDEPFSNLDPVLSSELRELVCSLQKRIGATTIWSTHSQADIYTLGCRVALLRNGRLEQVGRICELKENPSTPFVSAFLKPAVQIT